MRLFLPNSYSFPIRPEGNSFFPSLLVPRPAFLCQSHKTVYNKRLRASKGTALGVILHHLIMPENSSLREGFPVCLILRPFSRISPSLIGVLCFRRNEIAVLVPKSEEEFKSEVVFTIKCFKSGLI